MAGHMSESEYKENVRSVWKVTAWLTIITIIEVVFALVYIKHQFAPRWALNLIFIIASLGKAFFIIAEFMHLKYEKRALIISLAIPLIFLVWALIAFVWEADAWWHMKGFGG